MRTLPNMQAVKGAISFLWLLLFLSPHSLIPHHHVDAVSGGSSEFQLMSRIKERHPDFVPRTIVDVGANRGDWTVGVRSVFPTANFFMLEASPDKDAVLKDVISSHFTNEDTNSGRAGYSIAVMSASANETIPFFQGGDTGNSMFRENTHYYENDTPVMRISSTLDLEVEASFVDIETVDILKIDVQGAELMVLRGGPKVLEAATFVQLESGSIEYNAGGCCFYEIDEILRSHGFYLYDIGELAYNPTFFKTSGVGQFDILYVKPSSSNLPQGLQQSKFCGANKNTISSKEEPTSNHQDIPLVEAHAMSEESMNSFFRRIGPAAAWVTVGFVAAFILQMFLPKRPFLQRTNRAHISSHLSPKESSGTRYQRYTFRAVNTSRALLALISVIAVAMTLQVEQAANVSSTLSNYNNALLTFPKILDTNETLCTDYESNNFKNPIHIASTAGAEFSKLLPKVGNHRSQVKNAVFAFARDYSLEIIAAFVESLLQSGFDGDIVLGVEPWKELPDRESRQKYEYLVDRAKIHPVVVYEVDLHCVTNKDQQNLCQIKRRYQNSKTMEFLGDFRPPRAVSQIRYEFYWAWAQRYNSRSRILLSDSRDVFFQLNPFDFVPTVMDRILSVAIEEPTTIIADQWINAIWIEQAAGGGERGQKVLEAIKHNQISCSGTTIGGQIAIEAYLRAMIQAFDETHCIMEGCDQGYHQMLLYSERLLQDPLDGPILLPNTTLSNSDDVFVRRNSTIAPSQKRIERIDFSIQGSSYVSTLAMTIYSRAHQPYLRTSGLLDNSTNLVMNYDGSVVAMVHQYDRDGELGSIIQQKGEKLLENWRQRISNS